MKRILIWVAMMSAVLLVSGCGLLNSNEPDACDEGGTLFSDNFEGEQNCGWREYSDGGATVQINSGTLQISSGQPGQFWWTNPGRDFDDVIISVQTRQASGPVDNAFGAICRYQDQENFYIFLISGDGFYAIAKYQSGSDQIVYLTPNQQYVFSDIINQGIANNEIRASCVGNELALSVNGIFLYSVVDGSFQTGDIGLGVTTFQPGNAVVQFDNFVAIAP